MLSRNLSTKSAVVFVKLFWLICGVLGNCLTGNNVRSSERKEQVRKFGCVFENDDYFVPTDSIFNPVYGDEVAPMEFPNVTEFDKVLHVIKQEYSSMNENPIYTNIPMFIDFYKAYKKYSGWKLWGVNFTSFFVRYVPKYFPHTVCSSMAIEILDRLIRRIPRLSKSVHLATGTYESTDELLQKLDIEKVLTSNHNENSADSKEEYHSAKRDVVDSDKKNQTGWVPRRKKRLEGSSNSSYQEPPKFLFDHGHVTALIRIRIAGRLGYVLMDPGDSLQNPVVLMEDGENPHWSYSSKNHAAGNKLEFYLAREDYILSKYSDKDIESTDEINLYYIGKPYCSFKMTTTKAHITRTSKVMARRDSSGNVMALLRFNIAKEPEFIMGLRLNSSSDGMQTRISFGYRQDLRGEMKQLFDRAIRTLNYPGLERTLTMIEGIARDSLFTENVKKLNAEVKNIFKGKINGTVPY